MAETIVETKACKHCWASFAIIDKDLEFYDKVSPIFNEKKYTIPSPVFCPNCRQQRRLAFRNERKLYRRKCDASGKDIISLYSPDKLYKVYDQKIWSSDQWNPMDYGKDFDFSKSFSQQFEELFHEVPRMALYNYANENSDYNNYTDHCKNTYVCFFSNTIEDSYYINGSYKVVRSMDIWWSEQLENCYECFNSSELHTCFYCNGCNNSSDLFQCNDCTWCTSCLGCVGLRNKEYYIFNKQYTKEEYTVEAEKIHRTMSHQEIHHKVNDIQLTVPVLAVNTKNTDNCRWDFIYDSKNCLSCYECEEMNDCSYACQCARANNLHDADNVWSWEWRVLESIWLERSFAIIFSSAITSSDTIYYSDSLFTCKHCFWCIGLRDKQYCIFNKQYTKEEYETLVPKIIENMQKTPAKDGAGCERWSFFAPSLSPFGYNETIAQEYYPLSKEEAGKQWYQWSDFEALFPKAEKILKADQLPNISLVNDDILTRAIECEVTWKPFRIIKPELEFYRKNNLPLPTKHPDQRHFERMAMRNPRKLRDRKCAKCWADIKTTYAPERPEIVYCESCYAKEIYW